MNWYKYEYNLSKLEFENCYSYYPILKKKIFSTKPFVSFEKSN